MRPIRILAWIMCIVAVDTLTYARSVTPQNLANESSIKLALEFLETYRDYLDSTSQSFEVSDKIRRTKEDGFKYHIGNDEKLKKLDGSEDFDISFRNGTYIAQWLKGGKPTVKCSFPANIYLLTFSNKIELENSLIEALKSSKELRGNIQMPSCDSKELKELPFSGFYVKSMGSYIIPRLKHEEVYKKVGLNSYKLLIDNNRYQIESIGNILTTGYSPASLIVNLKVSKYGYKNEVMSIPFDKMFLKFSSDGCVPYWGVEEFDGKFVKGVCVWANQQGGYTHVISVTGLTDSFFKGGTIDATLHCYIRMDNLKSLFEEYPDL